MPAEVRLHPLINTSGFILVLSAFTNLGFHSGLQTRVLLWWPQQPPARTLKPSLPGLAARTPKPSTATVSAGSETRATSRWSAPAWAMGSAVRTTVSAGRHGEGNWLVYLPPYFLAFPSSRRGQEPGIWRQFQWSALRAPVRLHGKDLLFLHLGRTHRRSALVLNDVRLPERSSVLFLHRKEWWDSRHLWFVLSVVVQPLICKKKTKKNMGKIKIGNQMTFPIQWSFRREVGTLMGPCATSPSSTVGATTLTAPLMDAATAWDGAVPPTTTTRTSSTGSAPWPVSTGLPRCWRPWQIRRWVKYEKYRGHMT